MKHPLILCLALGFGRLALAQTLQEADFYRITAFSPPGETAFEAGSIELLPQGRLAVGTRRGEIWLVDNAQADDPAQAKFHLYASGLHEVLGLAWKEDGLYATTRYEVTRLRDEDGDDRADVFETVADGWGVSGDYHEYAFGSRFDGRGDLWVALCLTGSFTSKAPFRGWVLRMHPDGRLEPACSGIRSPGGIGFDADGAVYMTDNQGPWRGASTLQHLVPGSFQGHPGGNEWYAQAPNMGPRPPDPLPEAFLQGRKRGEANPGGDPVRLVQERARIPQLLPPAVYLVHGKIGNSPTFIEYDLSGGRFGPFGGQLFVADQSHSNISRVFLETVKGVRQGVVFPFRGGFASGLIGGRMDEEGRLYVGGSDRGWGARGGRPFCFERLEWTGRTPFEVHEMRALPDGFELTFTEPVDAEKAADTASYTMRAFTYAYREDYGGPEVDEVLPRIVSAQPGSDGRSVRLKVTPLTRGHVHELHLEGLRSNTGQPLLHPAAYYTLNEIP